MTTDARSEDSRVRSRGHLRPVLLSLAGVMLLSGCALVAPLDEEPAEEREEPPALVLQPATFDDLPGWPEAGALDEWASALSRSCDRLARRDAGVEMSQDDDRFGLVEDWTRACDQLFAGRDNPSGEALVQRIEAAYVPVLATADGEAEGLFTGYYEPELSGSLTAGGPYQHALYERPSDLVEVNLGQFREEMRGERIAGQVNNGRLVPYDDRAAIEDGALAGRDLELVFVDDPIDAFFLHIQGSGRIVLDDGSVMNVGYAGQNGHLYYAIGRELIDRGVLDREEVSLQSIRAWLEANSDQAPSVMNLNRSYVFFTELDGEAPLGAEGLPLTAGRSLAVDNDHFPYGVPFWVDVEDPLDRSARFQRLMVAQDTGGAIRGPVRGDVFWGFGDEAEERAGRMRSQGQYWLLIPRRLGSVGS